MHAAQEPSACTLRQHSAPPPRRPHLPPRMHLRTAPTDAACHGGRISFKCGGNPPLRGRDIATSPMSWMQPGAGPGRRRWGSGGRSIISCVMATAASWLRGVAVAGGRVWAQLAGVLAGCRLFGLKRPATPCNCVRGGKKPETMTRPGHVRAPVKKFLESELRRLRNRAGPSKVDSSPVT